MGADEEIGNDATLSAAALKISCEKFAGQQGAFPRRWNETQLPVFQESLDIAGPPESWTNFGQHTFASNETAFLRGPAQRFFGSVGLARSGAFQTAEL